MTGWFPPLSRICVLLAGCMAVALQAETVLHRYPPPHESLFDICQTSERQVSAPNRETVTNVRTRQGRARVQSSAEGFSNPTNVLSVTL